MKDERFPAYLRLPIALVMGLAISIVTLKAPGLFKLTETSPPWLSAFITHTFMWILSILIIIVLTKGKIGEYGFTTGRFRLSGKMGYSDRHFVCHGLHRFPLGTGRSR